MKTFLRKSGIFAIVVVIANLFFSSAAFGQTVTTDLPDYPPGSTVLITGAGFQANETVNLQVIHILANGDNDTSGAHQPWTITADANGDISSTWLVPLDQDELGATLYLTADGQSSLLHAEWTFTDAIGLTPFTLGTQSGNLTVGTAGSATFAGSMKITGAPSPISITLSISGLPAGVTFSPSSISSGTANPYNFTLTLSTTSATPTGNYPFTVTASSPSVTSATATGTLAVVNPTAGIYESYAVMNFGGSDVYYDLNAATGLTDFNGVNFGTYNSSQSLYLDGAQNKTYKCSSPSDVSASSLFYRIYPTSGTVGSFSSGVNLPFKSNDGATGCGGQNQTWEKADAGVNLLSGLCDGEYTIEIYTTATINTGTAIANNSGANYKATFSIDNTTKSGINQSFIVLNPKGLGNTFYDLKATTGNPDFTGSLGSFCTNETLVIAGAENKDFKCSPNDITGNSLKYRVYTGIPGSLAFQTVPISTVISTVSTGSTCFDQTWQNTSNTTNILAGLAPGTYTLEVYTEAAYTSNGICAGTHFANNGGANYKATFTVNEAPVITTTYSNISVNNDAGQCGAVVSYAAAIATGTPTPTIAYSTASGALFPVGITTVTVTATNSCGVVTKTFTVTVNDTELPTITAPSTVVVSNDASLCTASGVALGSPTFGDNCSGSTVANDAPATYSKGNTTVTWTVTDASGNTASALQTVTVNDTELPTITAPSTIVVSNDAGLCTASSVALGTPTFGDNCSGSTVANDAPAIYSKGNTTVTWTVTDASGNTAQATQVVTVNDTELPTITAPLTVVVSNDAGFCTASGVALGSPTFGDNCSGSTVANDAPATYSKGNTTVTWTVTDASGNTATASQTVTVNDTELPTITAPSTVVVSNDAGFCTASGVALGSPTFGDNCSGSTVANDAPAIYSKGNTTVTWTVIDASGNTAQATQVVTVKDTELPTITAPLTVVVSNDAGFCTASGVALGSPTFGDNCSGSTVANDAPATYSKGNTTVTWTVTDASGNTASASQTVTVNDTELPTITAPLTVVVSNDAGLCTASSVALGSPAFGDNCSGSTVANDAPATYSKGNTTVTWTVTDASGNTASASQTVTVNDTELPTIIAPIAVSVSSDAGFCTASGVALGSPTFGDNCSGSTVANDAPATYSKGNTTVTWTVTDASGNTAQATQVVTVKDTELPTITAPSTVVVSNDAGFCTASGVALGSPTFGDNCSGSTVANDAPATYSKGNTTVTWTVTDASGNTASALQTVTVNDTELPTIIAPIAVSVSSDTGICTASGVALGSATTTDNCSVASVTNDAVEPFALGNTTVTWTVIDGSGNTATATQVVTVTDDQNPTIVALPSNIEVSNDANVCGATVTWTEPSAADNCSATIAQTSGLANGATFPIGTSTVGYTATDASGNTFAASFTVKVNDTQAPILVGVPSNVTVACSLVPIPATVTAADNCSGSEVEYLGEVSTKGTDPLLASYSNYTLTRTWKATDAAGNQSSIGTQVITVTGYTVVLYDLSPVSYISPITLSAKVNPVVAGLSVDFFIDNVYKATAITNAFGIATTQSIGTLPEEVYGVLASVGGCSTSTLGYLPVYDPSRGFTAGNGSFDSPTGAYPVNIACTGRTNDYSCGTVAAKARFGFNVKYKKGSTLPQGEFNFQLKKTKLKFESTSFQWLVITGNKAQFKGTGKINDCGTYNFIVTVIDNGTCEIDDEHDGDGDDDRDHHNGYDRDENRPGYHRDGKKCNDRKCIIPDQYRIQITTTTGIVVYDNQMNQLVSDFVASNITRGAIEVNDTKITKKVTAAAPETTITSTLFVYPNPTSYKYTLFLEGGSKEKVQVEVFDMVGRLVKHIESNDGQVIEFGEDLPTGAYFTTVTQGTYQKTVRLIKQ